jgi:hypothetical protein
MIARVAVWMVLMFGVMSTTAWAQSGKEESICLTAAVIWCNNFEDYPTGFVGPGTPNEALTSYKNPTGLTAGAGQSINHYEIISSSADPGGVFSGTRALRWNYPAFDCPGDSQFSGCGIGYLNPFWSGGSRREIYFRLYHKWSSNFVWSLTATKGVDYDAPGLQTWYWLLVHYMFGGGMTMGVYNQKVDAPYAANANGASFGLPVLNQWYCFELHTRQSSAPGVADGLMEMWVGLPPSFTPVLRWSYPNIVTVTSGSSGGTDDNTRSFLLAGYWNGTNGQPISHPAMQRWADNIIVSTARVGCDIGAASATPPAAPTGLRFASLLLLSALGLAALGLGATAWR